MRGRGRRARRTNRRAELGGNNAPPAAVAAASAKATAAAAADADAAAAATANATAAGAAAVAASDRRGCSLLRRRFHSVDYQHWQSFAFYFERPRRSTRHSALGARSQRAHPITISRHPRPSAPIYGATVGFTYGVSRSLYAFSV